MSGLEGLTGHAYIQVPGHTHPFIASIFCRFMHLFDHILIGDFFLVYTHTGGEDLRFPHWHNRVHILFVTIGFKLEVMPEPASEDRGTEGAFLGHIIYLLPHALVNP